jgi:branched-chain amino acid transport system ATP-binding protein
VPDANGTGLRLEGIVASYGRSDPVVRGIDLTESAGRVAAIIGPNGSGKSSLLKTICGMLVRRAGTVTFDGRDISRVSPREFARFGIRFVPQGNGTFPALTIAENLKLVGWSLRLPKGEVEEGIERAQQMFPMLRQKWGHRAGWLSGGEQRQLEFARTAFGSPKLILLDEPSAGLSPKVAADLYAAIDLLRADDRLIVLVDHNVRRALEVSEVVYELRLGTVSRTFHRGTVEAEEIVKDWFH